MRLFFKKDNEQQIADLLRAGDGEALDRLYRDYADLLAGVCARYVTDEESRHDVLQESFISMMEHGQSFEYRGKGSLQAWATRIVINQSLKALKEEKRRRTQDLDEERMDLPDEEPQFEGITAERIIELLGQLPTGYRVVFNLYAIEGRSHKEIAEQLGIKPDTSASQFHRAKNMMARLIKEEQKHNNNS